MLTVVLQLMLISAQVNHHIYSSTDLMATDSLMPVARLGVTVKPPPGFLSSLRQPVFLPTPLPGLPGRQEEPRPASTSTKKTTVAAVAAAKVERKTKINNRRNSDGSYSFR